MTGVARFSNRQAVLGQNFCDGREGPRLYIGQERDFATGVEADFTCGIVDDFPQGGYELRTFSVSLTGRSTLTT